MWKGKEGYIYKWEGDGRGDKQMLGECIEKERRLVAIKCAWGGQRKMERPAEKREQGFGRRDNKECSSHHLPVSFTTVILCCKTFYLEWTLGLGGASHWTTQCHLLLSTYCHVDGPPPFWYLLSYNCSFLSASICFSSELKKSRVIMHFARDKNKGNRGCLHAWFIKSLDVDISDLGPSLLSLPVFGQDSYIFDLMKQWS